MDNYFAELPIRFSEKVKKTDSCWLWVASKNANGYGVFWVSKKNVYAHRYCWTTFNGEIPKGKVICHSCDTPSCVNPDHLFISTQKGNLEDMVLKNRSAKGEKHRSAKYPHLILKGEQIGNSKLKASEVEEIRKSYQPGKPNVKSEFSLSGLAKKYGVCHEQISRIINNKRWVKNG